MEVTNETRPTTHHLPLSVVYAKSAVPSTVRENRPETVCAILEWPPAPAVPRPSAARTDHRACPASASAATTVAQHTHPLPVDRTVRGSDPASANRTGRSTCPVSANGTVRSTDPVLVSPTVRTTVPVLGNAAVRLAVGTAIRTTRPRSIGSTPIRRTLSRGKTPGVLLANYKGKLYQYIFFCFGHLLACWVAINQEHNYGINTIFLSLICLTHSASLSGDTNSDNDSSD